MALNEAEMLLAVMTLNAYREIPVSFRDFISPDSNVAKSITYMAKRGWTLTYDGGGCAQWTTDQKENQCVS